LYQFTGWFIALGFPLMARSLMEMTRIPLLSALIYYGVFGILIRLCVFGRLPYFRISVKNVRSELVLFALSAVFCSVLYIRGVAAPAAPDGGMIANLFVFALLNGSFEHLVWVNIYELAGWRNQYLGVLACTLYVSLIHVVFWSCFIPSPAGGSAWLFILSQLLVLWIPLRIYVKTGDLTIWSIQHILYNMLAVLIGGFSLGMYLHY